MCPSRTLQAQTRILTLPLPPKATMFYIGSNVMDWPLQAQRGLSDGHEMYVLVAPC